MHEWSEARAFSSTPLKRSMVLIEDSVSSHNSIPQLDIRGQPRKLMVMDLADSMTTDTFLTIPDDAVYRDLQKNIFKQLMDMIIRK